MSRYKAISASLAVAMLLPTLASAAPLPGQVVPKTCDGIHCSCNDLVLLAENILNTGIYFAVFISAVLFAWAGWKMLSGNTMGNSEDITEAKRVLWNVMIGLVIILAAWLLVDTLSRTLLASPVWNTVCPKS